MSKSEEYYNKWQLQDLSLVGHNEKYQFTKSELLHFAEFHHQSRLKEVTMEMITNKSNDHSEYHFRGMHETPRLDIKFASDCCGNSFQDGVDWLLNKLKIE